MLTVKKKSKPPQKVLIASEESQGDRQCMERDLVARPSPISRGAFFGRIFRQVSKQVSGFLLLPKDPCCCFLCSLWKCGNCPGRAPPPSKIRGNTALKYFPRNWAGGSAVALLVTAVEWITMGRRPLPSGDNGTGPRERFVDKVLPKRTVRLASALQHCSEFSILPFFVLQMAGFPLVCVSQDCWSKGLEFSSFFFFLPLPPPLSLSAPLGLTAKSLSGGSCIGGRGDVACGGASWMPTCGQHMQAGQREKKAGQRSAPVGRGCGHRVPPPDVPDQHCDIAVL